MGPFLEPAPSASQGFECAKTENKREGWKRYWSWKYILQKKGRDNFGVPPHSVATAAVLASLAKVVCLKPQTSPL